MLSFRILSGIKIFFINCVLLSLIILNGCRYEEPVLQHKGQNFKGFAGIIETPAFVMFAAAKYYEETEKWPDSTYDLEKYNKEPFSNIDWASLHEIIIFEKLSDGGLKITSSDPSFKFTMTTSAPVKKEKNEVLENK